MIELALSANDMFCIEVTDASKELHQLIKCTVTNTNINDTDYKVSQDAGAFIQGGSNLEEGWILVEFWLPDGAEAFVDHINNKMLQYGILK